MNKWKATLNLKPVWKGGDVPESEVHSVGKYIAKELIKLYPDYDDHEIHGFELYDIVEGFDNVLTMEEYESDPFYEEHDITPYQMFNDLMVQLYGFADANRLWVETR